MAFYEMECLLDNMWMKNKESWEQTRSLFYMTAQSQSNRALDSKQMMPFPWDVDNVEVEDEADMKEFMEEMKRIEDKYNKN